MSITELRTYIVRCDTCGRDGGVHQVKAPLHALPDGWVFRYWANGDPLVDCPACARVSSIERNKSKYAEQEQK